MLNKSIHIGNEMKRLLDRIGQSWRYRNALPYPNLELVARQIAAEQSVEYMLTHMRNTPNYASDWDLHAAMIQQIPFELRPGVYAEFGVATGRTINHIADMVRNNYIHGFDSFGGLPETWHYLIPRGYFMRESAPPVRDNVRLHIGLFSETLPDFCQSIGNQPLALLHVDCDLYSSTVEILTALANNIVPGTIIIFDEYLNYPGWQQDEFRAWQEHCQQYNRKYEYIGRVNSHQQVSVRVIV